MKIAKYRLVASLLFFSLLSLTSFAQSNVDNSTSSISVSFGYSYTGVSFKEIDRLTTNIVNNTFNMKQKYRGDGFHVGIHKNVDESLQLAVSFESFKGNDFTDINGAAGGYSELKGFQIPLIATYLLRKPEKKLNFDLGIGLQYLKASAQQTANGYSGSPNTLLSEFKIATVYASFSFGVHYQILPSLTAGYTARLSVSPNGRSSDNGVLALRYRITKN